MKKVLLIFIVILSVFMVSCNDTENTKKSEEDFLNQYSELISETNRFNSNTDFFASIHSTIWYEVGNDIHEYTDLLEGDIDEDELIELLEAVLEDYDAASSYAEMYIEYSEQNEKMVSDLEDMFTTLNKTYGKDYDIDDLKDYYIESISYYEYVLGFDSSHEDYRESVDEYKESINKLQKTAEAVY